jgi:hypothetical protein
MPWRQSHIDDRTAGDVRIEDAEARVDEALDRLESSLALVRAKIAEERREADR